MHKHLDIKKELSKTDRTLDIGCGQHPLGTVALDIDTKNKKADVFADPQRGLPLKSEIFDSVVLSDVLEHVKVPEKVISESMRVLKKSGTLLITIPNSGHILFKLGIWKQKQITGDAHVNFWDKKAFMNFCEYFNLTLEKFKPTYYFKGKEIIFKIMPNLAPCLFFVFKKGGGEKNVHDT